MRDLVEYLARALAEKPEEVQVSESRDGQGAALLLLTAAREDLRRLDGRVLKALRLVLAAAASKTGLRYALKIAEPHDE